MTKLLGFPLLLGRKKVSRCLSFSLVLVLFCMVVSSFGRSRHGVASLRELELTGVVAQVDLESLGHRYLWAFMPTPPPVPRCSARRIRVDNGSGEGQS